MQKSCALLMLEIEYIAANKRRKKVEKKQNEYVIKYVEKYIKNLARF
jgi:hypothetical protein